MCVFYPSQLTQKRTKAVENSCRKQQTRKNTDTAKINLPLGQAWLLLSILFDITAPTWNIAKEFRKLKRQKLQIFSSQPRVGSDIWANYKTACSVYLLSDDPEMSQLIFKFLIFWILFFYLFFLFTYLSYVFILYIYLFFLFCYLLLSAIRHPPSAVRRPPSAVRRPPSAVLHSPFASTVCFLLLQTPLLRTIKSSWRIARYVQTVSIDDSPVFWAHTKRAPHYYIQGTVCYNLRSGPILAVLIHSL